MKCDQTDCPNARAPNDHVCAKCRKAIREWHAEEYTAGML